MKKRLFIILNLILSLTIIMTVFSGCIDKANGKSAYDIAVDNGFTGTETEWLESLVIEGDSAYDIAVANGFVGTEVEWLNSLAGEDGTDGIDGEYAAQGLSAYEIAVENGFTGTQEQWLLSLVGDQGHEGVTSMAYATNKAILSVVSVYCEFVQTVTTPAFPGQPSSTYDNTYTSAGAGVILRDNKDSGTAYIITNYHVVFSSDSNTGVSENIDIYLYAMEDTQYTIEASYIGGSLNYDIAVLKITNSDIYKYSAATEVELADYNDIYPGNTAIAIGNPEATGISASTGVVSVDSEYLTMTGADDVTQVTFRVMRIDTAVNSGNSGGGLFNENGKLIGIVNAKISSSDIENIAYAIPISTAVNAAENIIRNCEGTENTSIIKCIVGISLAIDESYAHYNAETLMTEIIQTVSVDTVSAGSIAAGKLLSGDVIVSFTYGGKTIIINRLFTLIDFSLNFVQDETLTMSVLREGVQMDIALNLTNGITVK